MYDKQAGDVKQSEEKHSCSSEHVHASPDHCRHLHEYVYHTLSEHATNKNRILPYILAYKPTIFGAILRSSCGGQLIRGSCHTARVDSQHDGYLSATLTACEPHMAWTISRSLGLHGAVHRWGSE